MLTPKDLGVEIEEDEGVVSLHPPSPLEPYERDPDCERSLDCVARGDRWVVRKSKRNAALILSLDERWRHQIRLNLFDGLVYVRGLPLEDTIETEIAIWLDRVYGIDIATRTISEVIRLIATRNSYHPVRDYLDGLEWDGVERAKHLLGRYFGAVDSDLHRVISRCFLVSAVARVRNPGCKVDTVLILQGEQGVGKSSGLRALAGPDWFSDSLIQIGDKDGYGALNGVWIYELSELDSMTRKEAAEVKAFISAQRDRYRPPYGRNFVTRDRQTVIAGTTNEQTFLRDPTGSRRFWPVTVGAPKVDAIERDRAQIWAEADHLLRDGWTWWLWPEHSRQLQVVSEDYQDDDSWEPLIAEWVREREGITIAEVLEDAVGVKPGHIQRRDEMRASKVLSRLGRHKWRDRRWKGRAMCWWHEPRERYRWDGDTPRLDGAP